MQDGEEVHLGGLVLAADTSQKGTEGLWDFQQVTISDDPDGDLDDFLLSFAQDLDGELYLLTTAELGPTGDTGEVYRVVEAQVTAVTVDAFHAAPSTGLPVAAVVLVGLTAIAALPWLRRRMANRV